MGETKTGYYFNGKDWKMYGFGGSGIAREVYHFELRRKQDQSGVYYRYGAKIIFNLRFKVLASGKKHLRVRVRPTKYENPPHEIRLELNDPLLNIKIIDFATTQTADGVKFRKLELEPQLSQYTGLICTSPRKAAHSLLLKEFPVLIIVEQ